MKNYWGIALGISLMIHLSVFFTFLPKSSKSETKISEEKSIKEVRIEIQKPQSQKLSGENKNLAKGILDKNEQSFPPPPYIKNIMPKLMPDKKENIALNKAQVLEKNAGEIEILEKVSDSDLKNNSNYMSYYSGLRSKLYETARAIYKGKVKGEVNLNFIVERDGSVKYVDGNGQDPQLIEMAVKIVRDSSPFGPFPAELRGKTCQFCITILFKSN
jgi:outer membrane biosynthesis protein TonB